MTSYIYNIYAHIIYVSCHVCIIASTSPSFQMAAIVQIGIPLEKDYGSIKIGSLYVMSGIMGTLCSILFLPNSIMVGASGSVFGLLGGKWAEWILNINQKRTCALFLSLFLITSLNLIIGTTPLLDNFAHGGGLIAGVVWGFFLLRSSEDSGSTSGFVSLLVAMVVVMAVFVAVLAKVHLDQTCSWCGYINCIPLFDWWSCEISEYFGPCSVTWLHQQQLNVTCVDGLSHYIQNVTIQPTQTMINSYCSETCGGICWNGY